ncbi:PEP-CTERM sorting domain-containing protein [Psychrosphaera sp. 1_MG-2023]|uniref:PEP-CTERM sorting domain-containing protein n=1 Tax=Psychrosphaera sp. 1_MG-2023 TaxID=3062643 RepID=UPI0026E1EDC8|nr:PEP-CTERM sorting domain-containing protein [Psychrosphaera sp. 1_MG-2023]MDO6718584.1 PEP-CTERM sorting domain-containing protein [Psychrosphaera sp. 1_MG-2023]
MKINKIGHLFRIFALVSGLGFMHNAYAGLIIPDSATVESGTAWNTGGGVGQLVDGYTTAGSRWFGFRPLSGNQDDRVRLTLDDNYDLSSVSIWNNGGGIDGDSEGLKDFQLTFLDENLFSLNSYSGSLLDLQSIQTQAISATNVSFIDLTFKTSHGANYAIIAEIQFEGVTTADVPEPPTLAIFALGLIGLASRKLRKSQ